MKNIKKILITWWGSFQGGGETAGDLFSLESVVKTLKSLPLEVHVSNRLNYKNINLKNVNWETVNTHDYSILIFVCGPLIKTEKFELLIKRFVHCKKIAVGVSILPITSNNYFNPFDLVFARDHSIAPGDFFDLALNMVGKKIPRLKSFDSNLNVGICLRKQQREYGVENCYSTDVDNMLEKIFYFKEEYKIFTIDTRLYNSFEDPMNIYKIFSKFDLVITTRLHGALFCIGNAVPFIAIDQIKGGAKVYSILKNIGWNHTYLAESVKEQNIIDSILTFSNIKQIKKQLFKVRKECILKAETTLEKFKQEFILC